MAIRLITGVPGAGKSYYTVHHIAKNYCVKDHGRYVVREDYCLVANIEGLILDHVDLDEILEKNGGVHAFFTTEMQEKVVEKYAALGKKVVYFFDECQNHLPSDFKGPDVVKFFAFHRHLGIDIYLITQRPYLISKKIAGLAEYEMNAVPRTVSLLGFHYVQRVGNLTVRKVHLKKKSEIFELYKSFRFAEAEKIRHPLATVAGVALVFFVAAIFFFKVRVYDRWTTPEVVAAEVKTEEQKTPAARSYPPPRRSPGQPPHRQEIIPRPTRLVRLNNIVFTGASGRDTIKVFDPVTQSVQYPSALDYKVEVRISGGFVDTFGHIPIELLPVKVDREAGPMPDSPGNEDGANAV